MFSDTDTSKAIFALFITGLIISDGSNLSGRDFLYFLFFSLVSLFQLTVDDIE